jgi:hypothetical protein
MNPKKKPFNPPQDSRATRKIPVRSKASSRGIVVAQLPSDNHPRRIQYESKLEHHILYLLLARGEVHDIWDQPPGITFRDGQGRVRVHFYDYLVQFSDARRIALAIKPFEICQRTGFRQYLQHVRAATDMSYAHEVVLMTERSFRRVDALNAARLHFFRRHADVEADRMVAQVAQSLAGPTRIEAVVAATELGERGFAAAFRGIYTDVLHRLDEGEITPRSQVCAAPGAEVVS